jgi:hypothetical protein
VGKPPSRWRTWHKVTRGVVSALVLFFCGIALFAPDPQKTGGTGSGGAAQPVAQASAQTTPATATATATRPAATTTTKTAKPTPTRTTAKPVYFANCDAVADAGLSEIRKGRPGYRTALDHDGDDIACEADDDEPTADDDGTGDDSGGTDPRFATCAAAQKAGYGPYTEGQDPEYDWYQDRDNDGEVCE